MTHYVKSALKPLQNKRILDLYSGAGNFSLPLAPKVREIIAVEENPSSVEDGKRNMRLNQIENMRFLRISAETYNISNYGPLGVVLAGPPQAGLPDRLVGNILKAQPELITMCPVIHQP